MHWLSVCTSGMSAGCNMCEIGRPSARAQVAGYLSTTTCCVAGSKCSRYLEALQGMAWLSIAQHGIAWHSGAQHGTAWHSIRRSMHIAYCDAWQHMKQQYALSGAVIIALPFGSAKSQVKYSSCLHGAAGAAGLQCMPLHWCANGDAGLHDLHRQGQTQPGPLVP